MSSNDQIDKMLNKICEKVNSCLARLGRADLACDREWLRLINNPSSPPQIIAHVPVSSKLSVPVVAGNSERAELTELAKRFVKELPIALINIAAARRILCRYAASMRRAAVAAIDDSRLRGLEFTVIGITFRETRAYYLNHSDWRKAASYILAEVRISGLDHDLRPMVHVLMPEDPEDVAFEITRLDDTQREYQDARDKLRNVGASVAVDEITLRHLDRYGIEWLPTLRRVCRDGHLNLPVTKMDGTEGELYVGNYLGLIQCHIIDNRDYVWLGDKLSLKAMSTEDFQRLVGKPVAEVCTDELYSGMTFVSPPSTNSTAMLIDQPIHLVDFASGRFWQHAEAA